MRITIVVLFCTACGPQSTPAGSPITGAPAQSSTESPEQTTASIPASSTCPQFDPSGVWTLRSNIHEPHDVTLHRDNTVALSDGTLRWTWEDEELELEGCLVRFSTSDDDELCDYVVVESEAAVKGFVWCCEQGGGKEVERAICDTYFVSGVVRLKFPGGSPP